MIISASRRTDIPAFYSRWFFNRLKAKYVDVANPFNPNQVRRVNLKPEDVDAIVFWTRNSRPILKYLSEIDRLGYGYYFLYTITGYPKELEENLPSLEAAIRTFKELSNRIGPKRVIWRYDPIILSSITDREYHRHNFERIASGLSGHTKRVIISFVDIYKKVRRKIRKLSDEKGIEWYDIESQNAAKLAADLKEIAGSHGFEIQSCAEDIDLSSSGIIPGKCIDNELINVLFDLNLPYKKDPHQRKRCLCTRSVDIGAYDTCGYRCVYCYANSSFEKAAVSLRNLDANSSSLYYNA
jgi:hypothetical protein